MHSAFEAKLCHQVRDETLFVCVCGEFTYVACPWFDAVFADARPDVKRLVVDCDNMTQVDSTAMGMLLYMDHVTGTECEMQVVGVRGQVMDAIRKIHLHQILNVYI